MARSYRHIVSFLQDEAAAVQAEPAPDGDVNSDGEFNMADLVLLQKWLLGVPDTKLANRKAADLCSDNKLDVFDLICMRKKLIS
ncbi:dockerin type I repeat-containing protein [Ruminococcus sp.]|uniref:dockerin type I repeat-containing protein n=1 Tax=Ruminococcus sp. TaxID=41978 RepID=UPI0025D28201|nr:dockerin type I repeat-containing protein [Ruminococcus sp.]